MNVTNLILYLRSKIGDTSLDQQMLSKAIKLLELGAINTVSSFSSLPSVSTARIDELYLVEFDGLYRTNGIAWIPFTQSFSPTFAWGSNLAGILGDNTIVNKSSPVSVVGGFTDWCHIEATDGFHSIGVRRNGTAWAWGCNNRGQLGTNSTTTTSSPVSVVGGFTDWCQVSGAAEHSVGVRQNGTAWAWGCNSFGQLGDNTIVSKSSPVSVVGGFTDWCQLSAGEVHNLGVRQNGTAWAWGSGAFGRLGDSVCTSKSSPVSVFGAFTDWCQVSAGYSHSLGVRQNGTAWGWGANCCGQIGNNSTANNASPVSVVGGFTDWCQLSAGRCHSLGVRQNGSAWAWGNGLAGRLGDDTAVSKSSPVSVVGGFTDWCLVDAGRCYSLGVRTNGTAWAWGDNNNGQLGDNTITSRSSPVSVVGGFTDWIEISAGTCHSLAIRKPQQ